LGNQFIMKMYYITYNLQIITEIFDKLIFLEQKLIYQKYLSWFIIIKNDSYRPFSIPPIIYKPFHTFTFETDPPDRSQR
jgi:hypothetical protein